MKPRRLAIGKKASRRKVPTAETPAKSLLSSERTRVATTSPTAGLLLTDFDLHLFGEGKHELIYEKLGARPITREGKRGVAFAVWAPNARRVSVVGNFNQWDA